MAKQLTAAIQTAITNKRIGTSFVFELNGVDYSSYVASWSVDSSKEFGSAAASFTLINDGGIFGDGGTNEIHIGDIAELIEKFEGDVTEFQKFYGIVNQRSIVKEAKSRVIVLQCLDYISVLQFLDIDYVAEAAKIEVNDEVLTPNYLPSPNDNLAQIFDFAHEAIADSPRPILQIRNTLDNTTDPQYDGFEMYYDVGQVKLGAPLNTKYNYELVAANYFFYPEGLYIEDILESILTLPDGYNGYLFGETSAQNVIDNHMTTTFLVESGLATDTMTPNYSSSEIEIRTDLTAAYTAGSNTMYVTSTSGFPTSGTGNVNGDAFSWTGKTDTTFTGIPTIGDYSMKDHAIGSFAKYEYTYPTGQVWYLAYSNLTTTLVSGNFTVPGSTVGYIDKRFGRIILTGAISTSATVTCNVNYSFKTLQATGVELNTISFRSREVSSRFEAISKLRDYLAPNYIIRTKGDNKIWATYLSQKSAAYDYELALTTSINYLEDEDLYTRVLMYCKNKNPTNITFNEGIEFETTGNTYSATVLQQELTVLRDETAHWVYGSSISGVGKIKSDTRTPLLYVNAVPIDNKAHQQILVPVIVETTTRTETTTTTGGK